MGMKRKRSPNGLTMARVYRQLSDLLKAGVALLRAIEIIEKQSEPGMLPEALAEVRKALQSAKVSPLAWENIRRFSMIWPSA